MKCPSQTHFPLRDHLDTAVSVGYYLFVISYLVGRVNRSHLGVVNPAGRRDRILEELLLPRRLSGRESIVAWAFLLLVCRSVLS